MADIKQLENDDYVKYHDDLYKVSGVQPSNKKITLTKETFREDDVDKAKLWKFTQLPLGHRMIDCLVHTDTYSHIHAVHNNEFRVAKEITHLEYTGEDVIQITYKDFCHKDTITYERARTQYKIKGKITPKLNALATMSPKIISTCLKINQESLTKNYELFMVYEKFVKNVKVFLELIKSYRKIVNQFSEELGTAMHLTDDSKLSMYVKENSKMMEEFYKEVDKLISKGVDFSDDIHQKLNQYLPPFNLKLAKPNDSLKIMELKDGKLDSKDKLEKAKFVRWNKKETDDVTGKITNTFTIEKTDSDGKLTFTQDDETTDSSICTLTPDSQKYKIFNTNAIGRYHQQQEFGTDLRSIFENDMKENPAFKEYATHSREEPADGNDTVGSNDQIKMTKERLNKHFEELLTEDEHFFAPIIRLKCGDVYYPKKKGDSSQKYEYEVTHVSKLDL